MRVVLIGAGGTDFYYHGFLQMTEETYRKHVAGIAESLCSKKVDIALLPDKGIVVDVAKAYKQYRGQGKVIQIVPEAGEKRKTAINIGLDHLENYPDAKVEIDGEQCPLFDGTIDTQNWFKHDIIIGLLGDVVLYLGAAPGAEGERHYATYFYKLLKRWGLNEAARRKVFPEFPNEIKAGKNYRMIAYMPFLSGRKLARVDEAYLERGDIAVRLVYAEDAAAVATAL